MRLLLVLFIAGLSFGAESEFDKARDRQDRPAMEKIVVELQSAAGKSPKDADAQYRVALASSYLAEVALEMRDKKQAQQAAEAGIQAADRAIAIKPNVAEYHRVLATLCGQVIPANVLAGMSYGKRAKDAVAKALELDPKSSKAYVAQGVGNYYMPAAFGGGADLAIRDLKKAIELDPKSAEAYMWLGITLRKAHRNPEAREAFKKSLELNPNRIWTKQQLEKTPA
ncbi:MAG: tetratricopeptide repeat protein [Bryobacteraceae bacterium]